MRDEEVITLAAAHLGKPFSGKVRETFSISEEHIAPLVTTRLSSHDFPLGFTFPRKAEVIVACDIFWKQKLEAAGIPTDLVAFGPAIDDYLPRPLQGNRTLWQRMTIRKRLQMIPVECIGRFVLDGSMWKAYKRGERTIYGYTFLDGLERGAELSPAMFTPTTKAPQGEHDKPRDAKEVMREHPGIAEFTLNALNVMDDELMRGERAKIGDTKFEIGVDPRTGKLALGDETGTPDSSRIYELRAYRNRVAGKMPENNDKEYIRDEMVKMGIDRYDPASPGDCEDVRRDLIPNDAIITEASRRYLRAFTLMTGKELREFHVTDMNIPRVA